MVITRAAAFETDEGKPAHDEFWLPAVASMKTLKELWAAWNSIQFIYNEDGTLFGMFIEPSEEHTATLEAWLSQNTTLTTVEPGPGNFAQGPDQPTTVEFSGQGQFNISPRSWAQNYIDNFPGKNNVH